MKKRTLLFSVIVIFLCAAVTVAAVLLLPKGNGETEHLNTQGAEVDLTLTRTRLTANTVKDGLLKEESDAVPADFTSATKENVFGLQPGSLILPGSYYEAELRIENRSKQAACYWVGIAFSEGNALGSQLKATVRAGEKEVSGFLNEGLTLGSEALPVAAVKEGEASLFSVRIEFVSGEGNNAAQNATFYFDVVVYAVPV